MSNIPDIFFFFFWGGGINSQGVLQPHRPIYNEYFWGYEEFVDIFELSSQSWTLFKGHFYAFRVFS